MKNAKMLVMALMIFYLNKIAQCVRLNSAIEQYQSEQLNSLIQYLLIFLEIKFVLFISIVINFIEVTGVQ